MGMAISHQRLWSDLHQHLEIILDTVLTHSDASAVVSAAVLLNPLAVIVDAAWRMATNVT